MTAGSTTTSHCCSAPGGIRLIAAHRAIRRLRKFADPARAKFLLRFFKTAPGEYLSLSLADLRNLLDSKWHEERLLALVILTNQYARGGDDERDAIYTFYLASTDRINNWDLVDVSAGQIVGRHLANRDRAPIYKLAKSWS